MTPRLQWLLATSLNTVPVTVRPLYFRYAVYLTLWPQAHSECQGTRRITLIGAFFFVTQHPPVWQDLIIEASRSHTPHSVRLVWSSDQSDAETSTW